MSGVVTSVMRVHGRWASSVAIRTWRWVRITDGRHSSWKVGTQEEEVEVFITMKHCTGSCLTHWEGAADWRIALKLCGRGWWITWSQRRHKHARSRFNIWTSNKGTVKFKIGTWRLFGHSIENLPLTYNLCDVWPSVFRGRRGRLSKSAVATWPKEGEHPY